MLGETDLDLRVADNAAELPQGRGRREEREGLEVSQGKASLNYGNVVNASVQLVGLFDASGGNRSQVHVD